MKNRLIDQIRCGWHSGFPLCCILWYLLPWKLVLRFAKWEDNATFYHRALDRRPPIGDIPDLSLKGKWVDNNFLVTGYRLVKHKDWGMIPCPMHLLLRRRGIVKTCFCGAWTPEVKAKVLKEHPKLCVKE